MIDLVTFLKAADVAVDASSLKVHLACWTGQDDPLDIFHAGKFAEWQECQGRKNFECSQVIGLVDKAQGRWLFAGVYEILGCRVNSGRRPPVRYRTQLLPGQDDWIGRIIVQHNRTGRNSYRVWKPGLELTLLEILRKKEVMGEFPGYKSVVLSYSQLKSIVDQQIESWRGPLSNVRGVYLITDAQTGMHYVGQASGQDGIWQRWCRYANTGHGGNVELKKLLKNAGPRRVLRFQYSILEIADTHATDDDILARESHWIQVLKSRGMGLNR